MEQISKLITQKVNTMAEAEDRGPLQSKRKAITAILPYAVWRERGGQPEILDTVLRAARASRMSWFMWFYIHQSARALLFGASPRAIVLTSPHVTWSWFTRVDLVQQWAAAASAIPRTEQVAQDVVGTLLQIASNDELLHHITVDVWSWLTERPSLPPVYRGRYVGTCISAIKLVRSLNDVEVLKSYLLLVWSEWNGILPNSFGNMSSSSPPIVHDTILNCPFSNSSEGAPGLHQPDTSDIVSCCFCAMRILIREDFGGIGMGHHRADLFHRLDHVLAQLDRGLEYLKQHDREFNADDLKARTDQYRMLRETLLDTNTKAISRVSRLSIVPFCILTSTPVHTGSRAIFMCSLPLPFP